MPKTKTAPSAPQPIPQSELAGTFAVLDGLEQWAASIGRRLLAGAPVEPGPVTLDWDGEPDPTPSLLVGYQAAGLTFHRKD